MRNPTQPFDSWALLILLLIFAIMTLAFSKDQPVVRVEVPCAAADQQGGAR